MQERRLLFFDSCLSYPVLTGQRMRNHKILINLARKFDKTLYVTFFSKEEMKSMEIDIEESVAFFKKLGINCKIFLRSQKYHPMDLLKGLFTNRPFTLYNYYSAEVATFIAKAIQEFMPTVVHSGGVLNTQYFMVHTRDFVLGWDWHNVESEVLYRYANSNHGFTKKLYAILTARKVRRFERKAIPLFDLHFAVSAEDAALVKAIAPQKSDQEKVKVCPNGTDLQEEQAILPALFDRPRVLFVGELSYHANAQGIVHFIEKIYPGIKAKYPLATLTIVGKNPSAELKKLASFELSILIKGFVPDLYSCYRECNLVVVPLLVGGGSRIKIVEAMGLKRPVLATTLGAEGLPIKNGVHFFECNQEEDYIRALDFIFCKANSFQLNKLCAEAFQLVKAEFRWEAICDHIYDYYLKKIEEKA
ncbi:MAG: glycosyltransferase [Oligoflexia bacterium]|nr:glycosyltransferase [Oligoflexia bacterium]MBF0365683.1 glycosyltransferase [Oligoflexia bacterium]